MHAVKIVLSVLRMPRHGHAVSCCAVLWSPPHLLVQVHNSVGKATFAGSRDADRLAWEQQQHKQQHKQAAHTASAFGRQAEHTQTASPATQPNSCPAAAVA
jgi:hypothetical protein